MDIVMVNMFAKTAGLVFLTCTAFLAILNKEQVPDWYITAGFVVLAQSSIVLFACALFNIWI